jgi:hypothetical protein
MKHLNFSLKSLLGIMTLMLLVGMWVAPAAAAPPDEAEREYTGLKYALKWAVLRLDAQQDNIDNARAAVDLVREFIADEQAAGNDTSALETALAEAVAKLDEAQALHDTAAQILEEKAGFDDDGNVVDPQQARDTLKNAGRAMRDAAQILREARQEFRQAFREYRQSKRG